MGRIKTKWMKHVAEDLVEIFPEKFNEDFANNKKELETLKLIHDKPVRNKVAGYIIKVKRREF